MIVNRYPGCADRGVLREKNPLGLPAAARVTLARSLCDILADLHRLDIDPTDVRAVWREQRAGSPGQLLSQWERALDAAELEPHPVLRWTAATRSGPASR
jgi:aminoglycoside phosphotransferase (APT) family kinase protein